MKSLLIALILLITGCAPFSIYGDPAQRQLRNQWSANYELCERLTVATLAPSQVRDEWTKEVENRGVDCNLYAATTRTALNDMPFVRWSVRLAAPKMPSTIPVPSQLIHAR